MVRCSIRKMHFFRGGNSQTAHTHTLLVFQGQQPHTPTENGILRELSEEKGRVKLTHEEKLSGTFWNHF